MNSGKCIVINADRSLLRADGTKIYARFFLALITAAAEERMSTIPKEKRLPCFVYMDEFGNYAKDADEHITTLFDRAREAKVGMIASHTKLDDLDPSTAASLITNTHIKFAADLSPQDAEKLAKAMGDCETEIIQERPKFSFAAFIKGATDRPVPLDFQPGALARLPHMTNSEFERVRANMRQRYSIPPEEQRRPPPPPPGPQPQPPRQPPGDGGAPAIDLEQGDDGIYRAEQTGLPARYQPQRQPDPPPATRRRRPKKRRGPLTGDIDTSS